jgi:hypothetical protein
MTTTKDLLNHACFLRNAAPREFEAFAAAFAKYARQKADDLVVTTTDVQLAQGHAQQCKKINDVLDEARTAR